MFESPRSLWQHFAVAIVAVLVIMSLSSVNANNENDQCMLSGKTRTEKPCTGRFARVSEKLRRVPEVNLHNQACAHEAQIRVLAVLVSPRTPFSLFCRRLENVSILSSLLCWKLRLILDFPWTSRILIWISCILI